MKIKSQIFLIASIFILGSAMVKAQIATGGVYTLNQSVVASGGGTSRDASGTVYTVKGTAGQPAAGTISFGGNYVLKSGFWTPAALAPTAAEVSISGRVLATNGRGLTNARVVITDATGQNWTLITSAFGYFHFDGAKAGDTLIISISSKRYIFAPQVVTANENLSGLMFAPY